MVFETTATNFIQSYSLGIDVSTDTERKSVPVSLPSELVEELDALVEEGVFSSRSDAIRYGARLIVREEKQHRRLHERADDRAAEDIRERMERKKES